MTSHELSLKLSTQHACKARFLDKMNLLRPWTKLLFVIEQPAPRVKAGRPLFGLVTMPSIYFLQQSLVCLNKRWNVRCSIPRPLLIVRASLPLTGRVSILCFGHQLKDRKLEQFRHVKASICSRVKLQLRTSRHRFRYVKMAFLAAQIVRMINLRFGLVCLIVRDMRLTG